MQYKYIHKIECQNKQHHFTNQEQTLCHQMLKANTQGLKLVKKKCQINYQWHLKEKDKQKC